MQNWWHSPPSPYKPGIHAAPIQCRALSPADHVSGARTVLSVARSSTSRAPGSPVPLASPIRHCPDARSCIMPHPGFPDLRLGRAIAAGRVPGSASRRRQASAGQALPSLPGAACRPGFPSPPRPGKGAEQHQAGQRQALPRPVSSRKAVSSRPASAATQPSNPFSVRTMLARENAPAVHSNASASVPSPKGKDQHRQGLAGGRTRRCITSSGCMVAGARAFRLPWRAVPR